MLVLKSAGAVVVTALVWMLVRYRSRLVVQELERYRWLEAKLPQFFRGHSMSQRQIAIGMVVIIGIFVATAILLWANFADSLLAWLVVARDYQTLYRPSVRRPSPIAFWMAISAGVLLWIHGITKLMQRSEPERHPSTLAAQALSDESVPAESRDDVNRLGTGRPGRLVRVLDVSADFALGAVIFTIAVIYFWPGMPR